VINSIRLFTFIQFLNPSEIFFFFLCSCFEMLAIGVKETKNESASDLRQGASVDSLLVGLDDDDFAEVNPCAVQGFPKSLMLMIK